MFLENSNKIISTTNQKMKNCLNFKKFNRKTNKKDAFEF